MKRNEHISAVLDAQVVVGCLTSQQHASVSQGRMAVREDRRGQQTNFVTDQHSPTLDFTKKVK